MKLKTSVLLLGVIFILIFLFCQFIVNPDRDQLDQNKGNDSTTVSEGSYTDDSQIDYKEDYDLENFDLIDESTFFTELRPDRYDFFKNSLYDYLYNNHILIHSATVMQDGFSFDDTKANFIINYQIDGKEQYLNGSYFKNTDSFDFYNVDKIPGRTNDLKELPV